MKRWGKTRKERKEFWISTKNAVRIQSEGEPFPYRNGSSPFIETPEEQKLSRTFRFLRTQGRIVYYCVLDTPAMLATYQAEEQVLRQLDIEFPYDLRTFLSEDRLVAWRARQVELHAQYDTCVYPVQEYVRVEPIERSFVRVSVCHNWPYITQQEVEDFIRWFRVVLREPATKYEHSTKQLFVNPIPANFPAEY